MSRVISLSARCGLGVFRVGTSMLLLVLAQPTLAQTDPATSSNSTSLSGPTRLFLGPTARPLPRGEGYFVLYGAVVPAFQVGITDRVSIGAGTFYLADGNAWVTPKVQLVLRGLMSVSATLVHFMVPGEGSLGFAFGSLTTGGQSGGMTLGLGAAYAHGWDDNDEWASGGPLLMIGGDRQLSRRVTFLSENYIVVFEGGVLMNGIRASWTRFSLDVGAMLVVGGGVAGGPIINLGWRF